VVSTWTARQIGAEAYAALHRSARSWAVLASVSGAIYIESDAEDILWIAASSSALHQRAVLLPTMPAELPAVGAACLVEDDCLHVGEGLNVGLCDAAIWSPERAPRGSGSTLQTARRIAAAIDQAAQRSAPKGALADVVFSHASTGGKGCCNAMEQELIAKAYQAVASLCHASAGFDLQKKLQDAIRLVGLGDGLTPSGDDLLGAFLFTLRTLDSAHRGWIGLDWQLVDGWLQRVRPLTNNISFAILADHAHGDGGAPLHELLDAALGDQSPGDLAQAVGRVSGIGHSSGWDMLAGTYCACSVVVCTVDTHADAAMIPSTHVGTQEMRSQFAPWKEVVRVC
jgi:hypothetical protein